MERFKNAIIIFLLIISAQSFGQDDDLIDPILIRLQARIISADDSAAIPYASIVLNRTRSGTITNSEGYFSIEMLNIDSLVVSSVGYQRTVLRIPHNYNGINTLVFILNPIIYPVGEVQVQGERSRIDLGLETGKPTDISPELRGDAFNEDPPLFAALLNPISFWQYYLSKREKQKREVRRAMIVEQNWEMHSKNYNKEMVIYLTGMTDAQAELFMIWFNSLDVLPYTSTEYEVRAAILDYFEIYKLEGRL